MENLSFSDLVPSPSFERYDARFPSETAIADQTPDVELTGESLSIQRLRLQLQRVGPYFRAALLVGEAGSGKGVVAAALHKAAATHRGILVTCDTFTLEAAAREDGGGDGRLGGGLQRLVDAAAGGSLFIDRIEELSPAAQSLLMRMLDGWERGRRDQARRGGEIRLIASSHEELKALAATGAFRLDLYQRIATLQIRVPSLRERMEDVQTLAQQFAATFATEFGRPTRGLSAGATERLQRYAWPGNVRELENVMRGAVLASDGAVIEARDLPVLAAAERSQVAEKPTTSTGKLQDVIDEHVSRVMRQCAGNKLRAAEMLGVSRSTLYRMLDAASNAGQMAEA